MATAEPNNGNNDLTADETFANDRDKADAKLHHKEEEHVARHHLIQQQKQPLIRLASGGDPTKLRNANLLSKSPSSSMSSGSASSPNSPVKANVSLEGAEKVPLFSNHCVCLRLEKGFVAHLGQGRFKLEFVITTARWHLHTHFTFI